MAMKSVNRDLLLLTRRSISDKDAVEHEVERLHQILFHVESLHNFCIANEIIDVAAYKVITNPVKIDRIIRNQKLRAFQFICNKN